MAIDETALRNLYLGKQLSMKEIGAMLGISYTTVWRRLHAAGIQVRTLKEAKITQGAWTPEHRTNQRAAAGRPGKPDGAKRLKKGYVEIKVAGHPRGPWIMEHDLVMEAQLGRPLHDSEVVHHRNHKKNDNRLENLQLFANHSEHLLVCKPWERRKS